MYYPLRVIIFSLKTSYGRRTFTRTSVNKDGYFSTLFGARRWTSTLTRTRRLAPTSGGTTRIHIGSV